MSSYVLAVKTVIENIPVETYDSLLLICKGIWPQAAEYVLNGVKEESKSYGLFQEDL